MNQLTANFFDTEEIVKIKVNGVVYHIPRKEHWYLLVKLKEMDDYYSPLFIDKTKLP